MDVCLVRMLYVRTYVHMDKYTCIILMLEELDITEDGSLLEDIEADEQSDWLNYTDSNLSCEEVKETDTTATEGDIYTTYFLMYVYECVHIQHSSRLNFSPFLTNIGHFSSMQRYVKPLFTPYIYMYFHPQYVAI